MFATIRSIKRRESLGNAKSVFYTAVLLLIYGQYLHLVLRAMYVLPDAWDPGKSFVALFIPLFTLSGLFIHHVKPNSILGIRSRWTLESEEVWNHTHKKARMPFLVASGLNYLILAIPPLSTVSRLAASSTVAILLFVYLFYESYLEYQRLKCSPRV